VSHRGEFRPALFMATLGVGSGLLSDLIPGPSFELGMLDLTSVLVGVWFALSVVIGVWRLDTRSIAVLFLVGLITWIGWEAAVNLALSLSGLELLQGQGAVGGAVHSIICGPFAGCTGGSISI
jgi:hypothetical protein